MTGVFKDAFGNLHSITKKIAQGGQGVVYRTMDPGIALKMEMDPASSEIMRDESRNSRYEALRILPIPEGTHLTLPCATLRGASGYVMPLLEDMISFEEAFFKVEYEDESENPWLKEMVRENDADVSEIVELLRQYLRTGGRRRRLEAYFRCACTLSRLHANGLVYCDFSPKNAFVSSEKDRNTVWLIDADNLNYQSRISGGYYTQGYAAPELYHSEGCTMYSDCYSFAVALFQHLTGTHPFMGPMAEGTDEDGFEDDFADDGQFRAYSGELPWICDSRDDRNHIDTCIQQNMVISPQLMELFDACFSEEGRMNLISRPSMFEWADALAWELDHSIRCKHCGMDFDGSESSVCPWCDTENRTVVLRALDMDGDRPVPGERVLLRSAQPGMRHKVPVRLVHGLRLAQADETAFIMTIQESSILLEEFSTDLEFQCMNDWGRYEKVVHQVEIRAGERLKCIKNKNRTVLIEVTIK